MSESEKRCKVTKKTWTSASIQALLSLIEERGLLAQLDARRQRNRPIFEDLATCLAEAGYTFTWEEVNNQWKYLKKQYYKVKIQLMTSGMGAEGRHWPPFTQLDELLRSRPRTAALMTEGLQSFPRLTVEVAETSFTDSDDTGNVCPNEDGDSSFAMTDNEGSSATSDSRQKSSAAHQRTSKHKRKGSGSFENNLFSLIDEERKLRHEELAAMQQESQEDRQIMMKLMTSISRLADSMQK